MVKKYDNYNVFLSNNLKNSLKYSSSNSSFSSNFSSSSENLAIQNNLAISSQKSTVANNDDAIKSVLSNPEEAIKTDISKLETTQTNKKLHQILEVVDGDTVKVSEIET